MRHYYYVSDRFLLLFKEKVAAGGRYTNKFIRIFRRRMTDKVLCLHPLNSRFSTPLIPRQRGRGNSLIFSVSKRGAIQSPPLAGVGGWTIPDPKNLKK